MSLKVFRDYDRAIKKWSPQISPWHGLVYALTICKRTAPLYFAFVDRNNWGDKQVIRDMHEFLTSAIAHKKVSPKLLADCLQRLEKDTPDTETFSDSEAATDSGIVHIYATQLIQHHNPENVYYIACHCYDYADRAAFEEIMPNGGIVTPEIESQAGRHKFVQDEIAWQTNIRKELQLLPAGDFAQAQAKIAEWSLTPMPN